MIPLAVGAQVNLVVLAMRAVLAVAKAGFGEVLDAGRFIAEIIRELGQRLELKYRFHSGTRLQ